MKPCRVCGTTEGEFVPKANLCRGCKRTIELARHYANREAILEKKRQRYRANPEKARAAHARYYEKNREKQIAYLREWRRENGEEANARRREKHKRNPGMRRVLQKAWRGANPERTAAYRRRSKETRGEILKAQRVARYQRNKDAINARRRQAPRATREKRYRAVRDYYSRNKAHVCQINSRWRLANPDKQTVYAEKRRARKRVTDTGTITALSWESLLGVYRRKCAYCGRGGRMTMDHLIPLSRGGEHDIANVVPACQPCNTSKRAKTPLEWFVTQAQVA